MLDMFGVWWLHRGSHAPPRVLRLVASKPDVNKPVTVFSKSLVPLSKTPTDDINRVLPVPESVKLWLDAVEALSVFKLMIILRLQ